MTDPRLDIATQVDRFVRRLNAAVHARAEAVDAERVGPLGGMALLTLAEIEPAPIGRLTAEMGRDKSQMTRLVGLLEAKGMLARTPSPDDGRVSLLSLTARGQAQVAAFRNAVAAAVDEILAPLGAGERDALAATLRKL
ncbi:MAG: MarR family transcriptional regulator [Pseudomonadota bacterium]